MVYSTAHWLISFLSSSFLGLTFILAARRRGASLLQAELGESSEGKTYSSLLYPALTLVAFDTFTFAELGLNKATFVVLIIAPLALTLFVMLDHLIARKLFEDFLFGSWRPRRESRRTIAAVLFDIAPDRRIRGLFQVSIQLLFFGHLCAACALWSSINFSTS